MNQGLIEEQDASIELRRYRLRTTEEQRVHDERMARGAKVAGGKWVPSGKLERVCAYVERIFSDADCWWLRDMYMRAGSKELSAEAKAEADTRFGLGYGEWFAELMRTERKTKQQIGPGRRLIWEEGKGLRWGWERNPSVLERRL